MHSSDFRPSHSAWQDSNLQHQIGHIPPSVHHLHPIPACWSPLASLPREPDPILNRDIVPDGCMVNYVPVERHSLRTKLGHWLIQLGERMIQKESLG